MPFTRIKNNALRQVIRLPRAGKIRLGIKQKSARTGKEFPKETEFFVCPPEVERVFGKDPKQLRVMLPTENEDMVLRQYYASYKQNHRLQCQGDGERAERRTFKKLGENEVEAGTEHLACPGPEECDFAKEHGCKARTDLMVIIPEVSMGAAYQLSTGSTTSDIDIRSGLEMAKGMVGRISWVPMMLEREERLIPDPKTGKMMKHWPVKLIPAFDLNALAALRADNSRIEQWSKQYSLPEPVVEGDDADTPIEFVETVPGDEVETATATATAEEIDPEASKQLRESIVNDLKAVSELKALEAVASIITKNAHKFSKPDLDIMRTVYAHRKAEIKQAVTA